MNVLNIPPYYSVEVNSMTNPVFVCLFVCLFLLLYVPCQQLWSLRDGQFT